MSEAVKDVSNPNADEVVSANLSANLEAVATTDQTEQQNLEQSGEISNVPENLIDNGAGGTQAEVTTDPTEKNSNSEVALNQVVSPSQEETPSTQENVENTEQNVVVLDEPEEIFSYSTSLKYQLTSGIDSTPKIGGQLDITIYKLQKTSYSSLSAMLTIKLKKEFLELIKDTDVKEMSFDFIFESLKYEGYYGFLHKVFEVEDMSVDFQKVFDIGEITKIMPGDDTSIFDLQDAMGDINWHRKDATTDNYTNFPMLGFTI